MFLRMMWRNIPLLCVSVSSCFDYRTGISPNSKTRIWTGAYWSYVQGGWK